MNTKLRAGFIRLLAFYLAILVIPLAAILITYFAAMNGLYRYAQSSAEDALVSVQRNIDNRVSELDSISLFVSSNDNLLRIQDKASANDAYNIFALLNSLPNFSRSNTISMDLQIYFKDLNYVVTPSTAVPLTETFFGSLLKDYADLDLERFYGTIFDHNYYNSLVTIPDQKGENHVFYLTSWPMQKESLGAIVIPVSKQFLNSTLENISENTERLSFILDRDGNMLASHQGLYFPQNVFDLSDPAGSLQNLPGGLMVSRAVSSQSGWVYYEVASRDGILGAFSSFQWMLFVLMALSILTCGFVTFYMVREKVLIGRKIFSFGDYFEKVSLPDLKRVDNLVGELMSRNVELSESLTTQQSLIRFSIVRRLMYGDFFDTKELERFSGILQLDSPESEFLVFMVEFSQGGGTEAADFSANTVIGLFIKDYLNKMLREKTYDFDVSEREMSVLVFNSTGDENFLKSIVHTMNRMITELLSSDKICCTCAVSNIYRGLNKVNLAYREASDTLRYMENAEREQMPRMLLYSDLPDNAELYYYPLELEVQLIQYVRHGNRQKLEALFQGLWEENFTKRNLSADMIKQFVYAIRSTIIRGLKEHLHEDKVDDMVRTLCRATTINDILNCAIQLNIELCQHFQRDAAEKSEAMKRSIAAYIGDHYSDSNLFAGTVADELGLSESALYQMCKDYFGAGFSEILERQRIDNACVLLKSGSYSVKEVSAMVGYNSDVSFRRAFKRVLHITPSEFVQ